MDKKRFKAEIINNQPHCGQCGTILDHLIEYNGAMVCDRTYTRFVRRCSNDKCNAVSIYYTDISLTDTKRITFNEDEVIILREK